MESADSVKSFSKESIRQNILCLKKLACIRESCCVVVKCPFPLNFQEEGFWFTNHVGLNPCHQKYYRKPKMAGIFPSRPEWL